MATKRLALIGSLLVLGAASPGCAEDEAPPSQEDNITQHDLRGKWAIDMSKVKEHYGDTTTYFLGMTHEESGLPPIPGAEKAVSWDLTAKRLPNGSLAEETGDEYAVIDLDGNKIDPTGYVNLIPMLKDTDPSEQEHIRRIMKNGDVLVYVHPESTGGKGAMERRASHVAMHYELTLENGREMVHHIDNPNDYGPLYNHRPDRHMPFHVYRFRPRAGEADALGIDDAAVEAYGMNARNWALITNDISPFADFFTLTLQTQGDLPNFADLAILAISGQTIPDLYCSGLAYANMNLGLNFPLSEAGLGAERWQTFNAASYQSSEAMRSLTAADLADNSGVKSIDRLIFDPYQPTGILNAWINNYWSHLPMPVRQQILADPQVQEQIVGAFSQLEWGDGASDEKPWRTWGVG